MEYLRYIYGLKYIEQLEHNMLSCQARLNFKALLNAKSFPDQ